MATSLSTRSVAPVYRARGALMGQSICAYRLLIIYYVFGELRGSKSSNVFLFRYCSSSDFPHDELAEKWHDCGSFWIQFDIVQRLPGNTIQEITSF